MRNTLLHYLTLRNPDIIQQSLIGKGTETRKIYGPDRREPWEDMTFENLQLVFRDVLSEEMRLPEPRNASRIPASKRKICTEMSVRKLAVAWNEHIVQHALDGAHEVLCQDQYGGPLAIGRAQFTDNDGRGDLKDEDGIWHSPDWIVYRECEEDDTIPNPLSGNNKYTIPNLIPGECKPSMKWKSEWLNGSDTSLRMKAEWVLRQVTKYMHLANTRYSFILSDEELVPVRLSTYSRNPAAEMEQLDEAQRENIVDLGISFEESDSEKSEVGLFSRVPLEKDPDGSFADESREIGYVLEWCSIPWANMGGDILTMNLALWWLSVLAMQGTSIKGYGTYTPLGETERGYNLEPVVHTRQSKVDGEAGGTKVASTSKRAAEELSKADHPVKRPRTRRHSPSRVNITPPASSLISPSTTRTVSQRIQTRTTMESQPSTSLASQDMISPSLRRAKGHTAAAEASEDDDSSSETTNEYDDPILLSFAPD
ncbi:hypothetical protein E0Z10_g8204 [Xylaria hypoxylon]|uniref:Uncharacterized protein n=1 Tax=Xylaria hypoxylon TaxID=37992 RepID=A0A4Z0YKD8_9PEZI|nr:hypothetical protein E0Z10_g8204 [Xylaria hypoxylon]